MRHGLSLHQSLHGLSAIRILLGVLHPTAGNKRGNRNGNWDLPPETGLPFGLRTGHVSIYHLLSPPCKRGPQPQPWAAWRYSQTPAVSWVKQQVPAVGGYGMTFLQVLSW